MVMSKHMRKKILEHLIGPTGSVILHILLVIALVKFVVFDTREGQTEIEVAMMEMETVDIEDVLDEIEEEIEPLDFEMDIDMPDVDVDVETPTEPEDFTQPEANVEFTALDVQNMDSPLTMQGLYSGRSAAGRAARLRQYGGRWGKHTEAAVIKALNWLKENQLENGSWAHGGPSTAMTGLGILTFLAHGETVDSENYGPTVLRAIQYLLGQLKPDGHFKDTGGQHSYGNAIGAYAVSEAFAMTRIPDLREAMNRSIQVIVNGQQPGGGWDYGYKQGARRDTSVIGWQVQALKAAQLAGSSIEGLQESLDKAINELPSVYNPEVGSFGYTERGGANLSSTSLSMTSIALLCYQLTGNARRPEARGAIQLMEAARCDWENPDRYAMYRWYYYTQIKFQHGGGTWSDWNNQFAPQYVRNQNEDGSWTSPSGKLGAGGGSEVNYGPAYSTTLAALALQVYYRLLPTFAVQDKQEPAEPATPEESGDIVIEIS